MLCYAFILALFVPALVAQRTDGIRQCAGGLNFPDEVRIANCSSTPCDIPQGQNADMQVAFRSLNQANTLRPVVMAIALGLTIEYVLPDEHQNACNHLLQGSCPLSASEDAIYHFIFHVEDVYPPIPVTVELRLVDHMNRVVFCVVIDIQVRLRP